MKVLIIIPAHNEASGLEKVIDELNRVCPQYDYIIINDGSKDKTKQLCKEKHFNVLHLPMNLGIGGAVQTGYKYAYENDYDFAVQFDGDGQHDAAYLDKLLLPLIHDEADIAIGSRFLEKEGFQSSAMRRMGIYFLSFLIKLFTRRRIFDVTSGYRAVNSTFIRIYAEEYSRDYPEPEAIVTGIIYGGRIAEIPVIMRERESGTSSIRTWKSLYYMIKVTLAIMIRRISYGIRR